jgi:hypothetical protein
MEWGKVFRLAVDDLLLEFDQFAEVVVLSMHPRVLSLEVVEFALEEFANSAFVLFEDGHFYRMENN